MYPLIPHLKPNSAFWEPCAGRGVLIKHLEELSEGSLFCTLASDIEPQTEGIDALDYRELNDVFNVKEVHDKPDYIITNPPWSRSVLHDMILEFIKIAPTWLLFDADWVYTKQALPYRKYLKSIVPIGRVSWMDNGVSGMDNCAWYHFSEEIQTFNRLEI